MSENNKKGTVLDTGRAEPRLRRCANGMVLQRAHKFTPATAYNRKDKSWRNE